MLKPIITEKSVARAAKKIYTFRAAAGATKPQIKQAAEEAFKVDVIKVRTEIVHGKKYRTGKRATKRLRPEWKKAMITIKPDQKIDLFETALEEAK